MVYQIKGNHKIMFYSFRCKSIITRAVLKYLNNADIAQSNQIDQLIVTINIVGLFILWLKS